MAHQGGRQPASDPAHEPLYKELLSLLPALAVVGVVATTGGALAVAFGMGLDALAAWATGPCSSHAANVEWLGQLMSYLRYLLLGLGGSGMVLSLLLLSVAAANEARHHTVRLYLQRSLLALALAAAVHPALSVLGCVAL